MDIRFYSRKAPRRNTKVLMDQISTGKYDGQVVSDLVAAVTELTDPAEKELILTALKDIALKSGNPMSVAASIKALMAFQPMELGLEDSLEIRILELISNPAAFANRGLQEAMAEFLYQRVSERVGRAAPFVDALIQLLDERAEAVGTTAYNTLMIVAANRPEYFENHGGRLNKMLGSINRTTRIQTTRLIAVLAMSHPEYVAGAEKTLSHISSFNPDGELKSSASKALQVLSSKLQQNEPTPAESHEHRRGQDSARGLADIMRRRMGKDKKAAHESGIDKRLLSMATNFTRKADYAYTTDSGGPEQEAADAEAINKIMDDFSDIAQTIKAEAEPVKIAEVAEAAPPEAEKSSEEVDLRRIVEEVQDDFSINADSILDAIGMGHLSKKGTEDEVTPQPVGVHAHDRPKRSRQHRSEPGRARATPEQPRGIVAKEDEDVSPKEFIASIESIISRTDKEHEEHTPAPALPIVAGPVPPAAADGGDAAAAENAAATDSPASPTEAALPDIPAAAQPKPLRPLKMPVVTSGVRISAMKFKSTDHSKSRKTPTPPKISIKPHIKLQNKPPIDGIKTAPVRPHPLATAPLAPRGLARKAEALPGEIVCHSCNAKMPEDSQRCAICGSDLKAPKVRCRKCGEINPKDVGKCGRCGSGMDE